MEIQVFQTKFDWSVCDSTCSSHLSNFFWCDK